MTDNIVRLPMDYFGDPTKGKPISNGFVYIGEPDLDPEVLANRKAVVLRQEDGTDVPILPGGQPLEIGVGGYIFSGDFTAQVIVEDNYSIKVLDKHGAQKFYVENVLDIGGGSPALESDIIIHRDYIADMTVDTQAEAGKSYIVGDYASGRNAGPLFFNCLAGTGADDGGSVINHDTLNLRFEQDFVDGKVSWAKFGADRNGAVECAANIRAAIAYSAATEAAEGSYLIESAINLTGGKIINADTAILLKNFDGVGLTFTGGSNFNFVNGSLQVKGHGSYAANTALASTSPTAHGVTITDNRVVIKGELEAVSNQGNGVLIDVAAGNANRSICKEIRASGNGEHGVRFSGTRDDSSVWQIDIYANGNRKSGIVCDSDFMGRNWEGFWYAEGNAIDTTSTEVDILKLRYSFLTIYAEASGSNTEIELGANTDGLRIRSLRRNNDFDSSTAKTNGWNYGGFEYSPGEAGGARVGVAHTIRWNRARGLNPGEGTQLEFQNNASVAMGTVDAINSATSPYPPYMALTAEGGTSFVRVGDDTLRVASDGDDYIYLNGTNLEIGNTDLVTSVLIRLFGNVQILAGAGTPEGVVTAARGSLFSRYDGGAGTCLYVKESGTGNTGWVAK